MGCDGGTIPRRDELVKVQKKPQPTDNQDFELASRWHSCHLSQQTLQFPVVMCGNGYMYNKVALIEALLNHGTLPVSLQHIKSLKDVKNLNLTTNPAYQEKFKRNKAEGFDVQTAPFICPVTGTEMTGKQRFVGLWSCGCAFSERVLKAIGTNICQRCQMPFVNEDVVILNGNGADISLMKHNSEMRQQRIRKHKKVKTECTSTSTLDTENDKMEGQLSKKRQTITVDAETKIKRLKSKYSVAQDPHVSDVYKSLFTSHKSEQQQTRAHWVTYNPFYN